MTKNELKRQFQIIDNNLNQAYEKNDPEEISKMLSDDWAMLESSTGLSTKGQFLNAIKDGNLKHSKMKKEVLQVKLYNDFAIVITRGKNEGRYLNNLFNAEHWVTNIYMKNDPGWVCVFIQEAPVICQKK